MASVLSIGFREREADIARRRITMSGDSPGHDPKDAEFYKIAIEPREGGKVFVSVAALDNVDATTLRSRLLKQAIVDDIGEVPKVISQAVAVSIQRVTAALCKVSGGGR